MSLAAEKAALRARARRAREEAARQASPDVAAQLAERFFEHIALRPRSLIAAYASIGAEVDPSRILERALEKGHRCALPRVALEGAPLDFVEWRAGEALQPGPFGTREPMGPPLARAPDIILVPLLAFDSSGHRLGYGGGYYDRTLSMLRMAEARFLSVGLAFAAQEVDALPVDPFDQRLDWIVTERDARRIGSQS
jgi:5-formyltetrahydrofolate cyclo-ligase